MKLRSLLLLTAVFTISTSHAQTRQQIDNLYTFARLYGYVRYFHPSDAVVVTDWDKLAIYGARQVAQASSPKALQQTLEQLFRPIAPTLQMYPTGSNPPFNIADTTPKDTSGMKVVCWQHDSYGMSGGNDYNKSVRTNSYKRAAAQTAWNFSTISGFIDARPYQGCKVRFSAAVKAEDLKEGAFRLWMRAALPNDSRGLYEDMRFDPVTGMSKNWRRHTISGKIDPEAQELYFGFGITNKGRVLIDDIRLEVETVNGWERIRELNGDFEKDTAGTAPAFWDSDGDKYLIAKTNDQQAASGGHALYMERTDSRTGMEKTQTLFRQTLPAGTVIKKDIGSGLSITMPVALWGDGESTYPLTDTARITRRQKAIAAKLPSRLSADDLYVRLADIIIAWNVIQHFHPYYAEWSTNWDTDLHEALEACYKDNTEKDFNITLKTLLAKIHDGHIYPRIPDMRAPAFLPVYWEPEPPLIGGKVLFLANGKEVGISGTIVGYVKGQRLATIIGEPCSGINGTMAFLSLPSGYSLHFTGDKDTNHDGSQLYMKGIQPDITVTRTVEGIREGRDEVLEKAIEICR